MADGMCGMTEIGAKVYRIALNSAASYGDDDAHLEWIHTGEEVVRHKDYEIALKRILQLEEQIDDIKECELCDGELHGTGVCLSCWNTLGAKNASLIEENRSGTNALKLSGQALSKALDDVERLLAENKRLVVTIKRGQY